MAEPIFPAPTTPIFSVNMATLLTRCHPRQNKMLRQELQSVPEG